MICHKNKSLHGISYPQLEQNILGVEMRLTWGLNPLASEFEPKTFTAVKKFTPTQAPPPAPFVSSSPAKHPPPPSRALTRSLATPATEVHSSVNPHNVPFTHPSMTMAPSINAPALSVTNARAGGPPLVVNPPNVRIMGPVPAGVRPPYGAPYPGPNNPGIMSDFNAVSPVPLPNQPGLVSDTHRFHLNDFDVLIQIE
jgi:hypothetical protein